MPSTLDYASIDPTALGPDETLWHEWVVPAKTSGCAAAILRFTIGISVSALIGFVASEREGKSSVAIATCLVVIGTGIAVLWALHALRSRRGFVVRVTDQRIIRQGASEAHTIGSEHRDLKVLVLASGRGETDTAIVDSTELDDDASEELISIGREGMAEIKLAGESPQGFRMAVFAAVTNGIRQRHARRRALWIWKPRPTDRQHTMEQGTSESWVTPFIQDEQVLWCGQPSVSWRREYRNLILGWLKSCYWTIGAVALVALPWYLPTARNGGVITLAVIASVVLLGQAYRFFVTPILSHHRLAKTKYALTNWRIVLSIPGKQGRTETSYFIDSSSRVEIEEDGTWGSVKVGYLTFEQLRDARELYDIATRTIATCRWSEPSNARFIGEPVQETTTAPTQNN